MLNDTDFSMQKIFTEYNGLMWKTTYLSEKVSDNGESK